MKQPYSRGMAGAVFACLISALFSASSFASDSHSKLGDFVQQGMELWQVPGMAVTVVSKDEVLFQQGFGVSSLEDGGQRVDTHTMFANASTTKAMIAAGLLMLMDEEKLSLDDRVTDHVPEVHFSTALLNEQISIRDLLAHRTGLPSTDFWTFFMNESLENQIPRLKSVSPVNPLRTGFIYQNTMFELAGLIIERVSGQRWDLFLRDRLWKPIGMNETFGARGQIPASLKHVLPYDVVDGEVQRVDFSLPADRTDAAGSAWTSIHDMGLWAQFLLRDGVTANGERLLSSRAVQEMFHPQTLIPADSFYPTSRLTEPAWISYGLGWFQQDFQGRKVDFHTGSLNGLIAIIGVDRTSDKAVAVLGNRDHAELRHAVLWEALDQSHDENRRDWNQDVWDLYASGDETVEQRWEEREKQRLKRTKPALQLADYAGQYYSPTMGQVEIVVEKRRIFMRTQQIDMPMSHWHIDTFLLEYEPWRMKEFATFEIGPDGAIHGLDLFDQVFTPLSD